MDELSISDALETKVDRLAKIEHERWSHWQRYVHELGERLPDGRLILPADQVARWDRQIATNYADLTSQEQETDREQVRRFIPEIAAILARN